METVEVHKDLNVEELKALRNKKKEELTQQQQAELLRNLSIRERLERKLHTDEIKLELKDDLGALTLRFRKLTPKEHDRAGSIQEQFLALKTNPDKKKSEELTQELYTLLGSVSMDGLDEEFWKSGTGYSPDIFLLSFLKVMAASAFPDEEDLKEIVSFRPF